MKKLIEIIFLISLVILGINYKDRLTNIWQQAFHQYFPCKQPIYYSIGTFDTRFGISKEKFIEDLAEAEKIWEAPIAKNLFQYSPNGNLKINLIYDTRQKTTDELHNINSTLESKQQFYDATTMEYQKQRADYNQKRSNFESRLANFNSRKMNYEAEVSAFNNQRGGDTSTRDRLNNERNYLTNEASAINQLQAELNKEAEILNAKIGNINQIADNLNTDVNKYNEIGEPLADGFNAGLYKSDSIKQEINIYQFDDDTKLIRVLAHELGHAIRMDHVNDSEAIMYKLNTSTNTQITESDLAELKTMCKIR